MFIASTRPVESFAEAALATEGGYPAEARATEETTMLLVPKTDFIELFRRKPELALRVGLAFEPLGRVMAHACGPDGRDERNAFAHAG